MRNKYRTVDNQAIAIQFDKRFDAAVAEVEFTELSAWLNDQPSTAVAISTGEAAIAQWLIKIEH